MELEVFHTMPTLYIDRTTAENKMASGFESLAFDLS